MTNHELSELTKLIETIFNECPPAKILVMKLHEKIQENTKVIEDLRSRLREVGEHDEA